MEWLNFHHLLYFWTVVRMGGVAAGARELRLAQPTVSGQLRVLEHTLGEKLLVRQGRGVVPTEMGKLVFRYADEIFGLGRELQDTLRGRSLARAPRLHVGVADALPKVLVRRLLEPALSLADPVSLVCTEDKIEGLLADLAQFRLDLVLADAPAPPTVKIKAFSHLLGETDVTWFATRTLAKRWRRGFPGSLDGAPVLLPTEPSSLRRALDAWFDELGVRPRIVAELEDGALLTAFGATGAGLFCAPTAVRDDVRRQHDVVAIGRARRVVERVYAISIERRLRHPAVLAISQQARGELFR
jgi:LysR family transcriptional regulator, transcriptional activator of nhaA